MAVQIDKRLERIDRVQQRRAVVLDGQVRLVLLGQLQLGLETFEKLLHRRREVLRLARSGASPDGDAPAGAAQQFRIPRVAASVDRERVEFKPVFLEQFLEPIRPEPLLNVVEMRAAGVGGPDVDRVEPQPGDPLDGLFDRERTEIDRRAGKPHPPGRLGLDPFGGRRNGGPAPKPRRGCGTRSEKSPTTWDARYRFHGRISIEGPKGKRLGAAVQPRPSPEAQGRATHPPTTTDLPQSNRVTCFGQQGVLESG